LIIAVMIIGGETLTAALNHAQVVAGGQHVSATR
jgi:hypothetical protein